MEDTNLSVRRLGPTDGENYRKIRLEALKEAPTAFASSYETEQSRDLKYFEDKVTSGCIFGAFSSSEIIGVAGFFRQSGPKLEHKGVLWGMYVTSNFRKSGIGSALVNAVLNHATGLVDVVTLSVITENDSAIALYRKLGFESFGTEPKALKVGNTYFSEMHMMHSLDS